jgi:penicillin-binding protein 2
VTVTPVQMAQYAATLANGGIVFQPHAVRAIYNRVLGKTIHVDYGASDLKINPEHMDAVRRGMYKVVNEPGGTATWVKLPDIVISGKTGTAQNPHGKDHSWFVAFAPFDEPKIAICVMVENAGFGSEVAAPIAQKLIQFYLKRELPEGMEVKTDSMRVRLPDQHEMEKAAPDSLIGPFVAVKK